MEFRASAEVFQPAYPGLDRVRRSVEPYLNSVLAISTLANLPCKLRYVPIVMPAEMLARYPARSKLRKKDRIYDCAPQLDYEVFVSGQFKEQVEEYVRGIALSAPQLHGLGASPEQVEEFKRILERTSEAIIAEQPFQTRH